MSMSSDQSVTAATWSTRELWDKAVADTRMRSPTTFDQWFAGIQFDNLTDGVLSLTARDEFVLEWVRDHFVPSLTQSIRDMTGWSVQVAWSLDRELENPVCERPVVPSVRPRPISVRTLASPPTTPAEPPARVAPAPTGMNPKHTFANFVVGPSNQLAHAAAVAAAGGAGRRYNPLFICGGTGLGKTHLVHAIAHRVHAERPDARIVYVSAELFTNDYIRSLQHHKMDEFRSRYRKECDLLLVDDIQSLAGREQTQEEFFHTFNALHSSDKQIVVTSDTYPQALERMEERLVSRFTWGLVADIQMPEMETRVAIVRKKAQIEGIDLPDDVAVYLAQSIRSNIRELEGTLIRLAAKSSLTGVSVELDFAKAEIAAVSPARAQVTSVEDIQRAVCHHFHLRSNDLLSKDRHKSVAFARHVAMYLCKSRLKCSFPELGRAFGNRDHTTVMSAVRKIESQKDRDPEVRAHLEAIERKLATAD
jgi:chromosomal replication initiator protein